MLDPIQDRAVGAMLGLAVGDAIGTTVEFCVRDQFPPMRDMIGGGLYHLEPGQWTDDTSMSLCLADSLLAVADLDPTDLMDRFLRWWRAGENSPTGACVDIGVATSMALRRYLASGHPLAGSDDPRTAGNGSMMRLAPVAVRWHANAARAAEVARVQSRTTHGAPEAVEACAVLAAILIDGITTGARQTVLRHRASPEPGIDRVASGSWRGRPRETISSTGYVVHTLEAALWAVDQTDSFKAAVLEAVNLGDDADTVGAVTGQIAGALYGASAIPAEWVSRLAWSDVIRDKALRLFAAGA